MNIFKTSSIALLSMFILSGCSQLELRTPLVGSASPVDMENPRLIARPSEFQMEMLNPVTADADVHFVLGIRQGGGPRVSVKAPIVGLRGVHTQAQSVALMEILENNPEADGIVVMQSTVETNGLFPIAWNESATVKGYTFKLQNLGPLNAEDSMKVRLGENMGGAVSVGRGGVFGLLD